MWTAYKKKKRGRFERIRSNYIFKWVKVKSKACPQNFNNYRDSVNGNKTVAAIRRMPRRVRVRPEQRPAISILFGHRGQRNWHALQPLGSRHENPPVLVHVHVLTPQQNCLTYLAQTRISQRQFTCVKELPRMYGLLLKLTLGQTQSRYFHCRATSKARSVEAPPKSPKITKTRSSMSSDKPQLLLRHRAAPVFYFARALSQPKRQSWELESDPRAKWHCIATWEFSIVGFW